MIFITKLQKTQDIVHITVSCINYEKLGEIEYWKFMSGLKKLCLKHNQCYIYRSEVWVLKKRESLSKTYNPLRQLLPRVFKGWGYYLLAKRSLGFEAEFRPEDLDRHHHDGYL